MNTIKQDIITLPYISVVTGKKYDVNDLEILIDEHYKNYDVFDVKLLDYKENKRKYAIIFEIPEDKRLNEIKEELYNAAGIKHYIDWTRFKDIKFLWEIEKTNTIGMSQSKHIGHNDIGFLIELIEKLKK